MLNKYLKKVLLTTVALFWASCDDSSSVSYSAPEYGCPSDVCGTPVPGPDETTPSSSSEESASGNAAGSGSSTTIASSSSKTAKPESSSIEDFAPLYGDLPVFGESSSSIDPNSVPSDTLYGVSVTEKTCVPGDSVVSYYPPAYSADILKMNAKQQAEMEMVDVIDSIVDPRPKAERAEAPLDRINWSNFPQCLKEMKDSLERFVALYGAPVAVTVEEVCSDGTKQPTEEYKKYQKMMEEWEANKPALDEEINKIFEDRFKELEQQLNQCLARETNNAQSTPNS
ncbi:hypothetical protein [uncultured Fibrobacter sp.]|uniref:hypothetical protein n=1 Tax=uncultured Fibrobacter sp. TaxID=261512 RepID=UPI0025CDAB34|nr:hypothetical protein [uncultured Fibrobacter sp.]